MQLGPGFWATFYYYFTGMTLIVALLASQVLGLSLTQPLPYRYGITLGLVAGLLGAYFNRSVTLSLEFKNKKVFTQTLNTTLAEMGFEPQAEINNFLVYQRPALRNVFSGKVFVQIEKGMATIVSRASTIKRLRQKIES
ncbi:MAG: hypothetical protein RIM23_15150 [Coleofasciculus sp. G3-WIS-01]|uniref:hypothetical protein n=1 Tax=Coleofasciculus sp. G3-WIS-01 TaxID=3069528 RepID=UPI0032F32F63